MRLIKKCELQLLGIVKHAFHDPHLLDDTYAHESASSSAMVVRSRVYRIGVAFALSSSSHPHDPVAQFYYTHQCCTLRI